MRCSKLAFVSLVSLLCCGINLASAMDCVSDQAIGSIRCRLRHQLGAKVAVVISSDVDHLGEALDFIRSWNRFPPCLTPSSDVQAVHIDRELFPALVLRLSCDWGYKNCELAAQELTVAAQPHMHCFSELMLKMNVVMFRVIGTGSTVADCFEYVAFCCVLLEWCSFTRHQRTL
jgi:hypothetical protein